MKEDNDMMSTTYTFLLIISLVSSHHCHFGSSSLCKKWFQKSIHFLYEIKAIRILFVSDKLHSKLKMAHSVQIFFSFCNARASSCVTMILIRFNASKLVPFNFVYVFVKMMKKRNIISSVGKLEQKHFQVDIYVRFIFTELSTKHCNHRD